MNHEPENQKMNRGTCVATNRGHACGEPPAMTEPVRLCDGHKFQIAAIAEGVVDPPFRPMSEWIALAEPFYPWARYLRGGRKPTGLEFAIAIRRAGLGEITASHAKNILTKILDRSPLPSLDSL